MNEWPPATKPYRSNPPEGSVGIVLPIRDGLRFFKLTYHSILAFTDYRYMLTVVDNMSGFQTRQYLESIRRNHQINVLQYQKDENLFNAWDLGLRFMFSYTTVKYGVVLTPTFVVEPLWLSKLIRHIETRGHSVFPKSNDPEGEDFFLFKREAYEKHGSMKQFMDEELIELSLDATVYKFRQNGFDPRTDDKAVPEKQEALK